MTDKITVIFFDKDKNKHDYNSIKSKIFINEECDESFEIHVFKSVRDVLKTLNTYNGFDVIVTIGENDYTELNKCPFSIRKKWIHFDNFNIEDIVSSILSTKCFNIGRIDNNNPLFSIFTCGYKTSKENVKRLYNSLCNQTYDNWNWWIIDDTPGNVKSEFENINDPRVFVIKNVTNHGSIGFNKHAIAMMCDGDYLVEVDHDDELTNDCLYLLKKAFDTYKDCDFTYSYAMEVVDDKPIDYGDYFALGCGGYMKQIINGIEYKIATTPDVNALTLRHIVGLPNHVRCWKKSFYHKIGGHDQELSVLDDMDLLIRTFLNGKMCKIPKVLYIQYEGYTVSGGRGSSTQSKRMSEIKRMGVILKKRYDKEIHEHLLKLGYSDPYWIEKEQASSIFEGPKENTFAINYTLENLD